MTAKNGKDKDKNKSKLGPNDRQKEIERLEKDVEDLRQLAGNKAADAEFERVSLDPWLVVIDPDARCDVHR